MVMLPLFCVVSLTGCQTIKDTLDSKHTASSEVIESVCSDYPKPLRGSYTQLDVGNYVIEGKGAYKDCRAKLEALTKSCFK